MAFSCISFSVCVICDLGGGTLGGGDFKCEVRFLKGPSVCKVMK